MTSKDKQIFNILTSGISIAVKKAMLEELIPQSKTFSALSVVAVNSKLTNKFLSAIQERCTFTKRTDNITTALRQVSKILHESKVHLSASKEALIVLRFIIRPSYYGFTTGFLKNLINKKKIVLSLDYSLMLLGLIKKDIAIYEDSEKKQCQICKKMFKHLVKPGICPSCYTDVKQYIIFRIPPVKIPINPLNFRNIDYHQNDAPISPYFIGEAHRVKLSIDHQYVYVTPSKGSQLRLPFEEYQKRIYT